MASQVQIRRYLALWFQLGKSVHIDGNAQAYCPTNAIQGNDYSPEFEACWQIFVQAGLHHCHLDDVTPSLGDLTESAWDLHTCARCSMPIAQRVAGMASLDCPCSNQTNWPVLELPAPQAPQDWSQRIRAIGQRLQSQYS
ncbi:MAG: hypothetical protein HC824_09325 [Synechococcales cyanobacterium RM1_1_8]|nr:hypothetical protein [Synechococcales cyanobacterium RM1_1_8]